MAEVFDSQRVGVSLQGLKAGDASPVVGSESRLNESGSALGDLLESAGDALTSVKKALAAKDDAKDDAILGQFALEQQQLELGFGAGAPAPEVASLIKGLEEESGLPASDTDKAALTAYHSERGKLDASLSQGRRSRLSYNQAQTLLRTRYLAQYPHLGKEITTLAGSLKSLGSDTIEDVTRDETEGKARYYEGLKNIYKDLGAADQSLPPELAITKWEQTVGAQKRELGEWDRAIKATQANKALTENEQITRNRQFKKDYGDSLGSLVYKDVLDALSREGTASEKLIRAQGTLSQWYATVQGATKLSATEIDAEYGELAFKPVKELLEGLSTGKYDAEQAANGLKILKDQHEFKFLKNNKGLLDFGVVSQTFGAAAVNVFADEEINPRVRRILLDTLPKGGNVTPPPTDVTEGGAVTGETLKQDVTDFVGQARKLTGANAAAPEHDVVSKAVSAYLLPVGHPDALVAAHKLLPLISDPKFVETARVTPFSPEKLDTVRELIVDTDRIYKAGYGDKYEGVVSTLENGEVRLTIPSNVPPKDAMAMRKIIADLNRAVKGYAHMNGSTDYNAAWNALIAEGG